MTPEQWVQLTPQQQWHHVAQYGPPPPRFAAAVAPAAGAPRNTAAHAGATCGAVGLLVFPIVLGPIALVLGLMGQSHAHRLGGRREAATAVVLGLVDIVVGVVVLGWLSTYL